MTANAGELSARRGSLPYTTKQLAHLLEGSLGCGTVALLVLRVPEFQRIAWRDGKRAALRVEHATARALRAAARRVLRGDDRIAHDTGSDTFAVAMLGAPRDARAPTALDCRAALERLAVAVTERTTFAVDRGWSMFARLAERGSLTSEIDQALARGARERERYEFFAAVGHELRTPLTSIRGYLETLLASQSEEIEEETRRRFLETARRETLRLARLVDGMLDFSLLDLSSDAAVAVRCDLREQILGACEALAPLAAQRGVRLERGPCARAIVGLGPDGCMHVLVNVIDNALKYGRTAGRVRVECVIEASHACVVIDDDGPGIAPDEYDAIFAPRVRGSAAQGLGCGIGLAIVRSIVERAGGSVSAKRAPAGGARFELRLPMHAGLQVQAKTPPLA